MDEGYKEQHIVNLNKFMNTVRNWDDRAVVLAVASFAEEALGEFLLAYFIDCDQTRALLNGFGAPLGTFSARIKFGFAIGVLNREQHDDLDIARRVRNKFAHNWQGITVEDDSVRDLVKGMFCHKIGLGGRLVPGMEKSDTTRDRLLTAIMTICIELTILTSELRNKRKPGIPRIDTRINPHTLTVD